MKKHLKYIFSMVLSVGIFGGSFKAMSKDVSSARTVHYTSQADDGTTHRYSLRRNIASSAHYLFSHEMDRAKFKAELAGIPTKLNDPSNSSRDYDIQEMIVAVFASAKASGYFNVFTFSEVSVQNLVTQAHSAIMNKFAEFLTDDTETEKWLKGILPANMGSDDLASQRFSYSQQLLLAEGMNVFTNIRLDNGTQIQILGYIQIPGPSATSGHQTLKEGFFFDKDTDTTSLTTYEVPLASFTLSNGLYFLKKLRNGAAVKGKVPFYISHFLKDGRLSGPKYPGVAPIIQGVPVGSTQAFLNSQAFPSPEDSEDLKQFVRGYWEADFREQGDYVLYSGPYSDNSGALVFAVDTGMPSPDEI